MMQHEFEARIGGRITADQYQIVERVYSWHPSIKDVGGKDQLANVWKIGGFGMICDMLQATEKWYEMNNEGARLSDAVVAAENAVQKAKDDLALARKKLWNHNREMDAEKVKYDGSKEAVKGEENVA